MATTEEPKTPSAQDTIDKVAGNVVKAKKKKTYMLHHPKTFAALARFTSSSGARAAASKAAVRGHTDILLRESGTKWVHRFKGDCVKMDPPHTVVRNGVTVEYKNKSVVTPLGKKFLYQGPESLEALESAETTA